MYTLLVALLVQVQLTGMCYSNGGTVFRVVILCQVPVEVPRHRATRFYDLKRLPTTATSVPIIGNEQSNDKKIYS